MTNIGDFCFQFNTIFLAILRSNSNTKLSLVVFGITMCNQLFKTGGEVIQLSNLPTVETRVIMMKIVKLLVEIMALVMVAELLIELLVLAVLRAEIFTATRALMHACCAGRLP